MEKCCTECVIHAVMREKCLDDPKWVSPGQDT